MIYYSLCLFLRISHYLSTLVGGRTDGAKDVDDDDDEFFRKTSLPRQGRPQDLDVRTRVSIVNYILRIYILVPFFVRIGFLLASAITH